MSLFDENAAILNRMAAAGSDLGPARTVDFAHLLPSRAAAEAFAVAVRAQGLAADARCADRDDDLWDVTVSKFMVPGAVQITESEEALGALAESFGGQADGWGFFRA